MLPSGLPEHVADEEPLARFLTQRNHRPGHRVRHSAFMPNPKDNRTSVYRSGEDLPLLRATWETHVAGERSLHGVAVVVAGTVRDSGLDVVADEPPPRHADIARWPKLDDPDLQKAKHKEIAMKVAAAAKLVDL